MTTEDTTVIAATLTPGRNRKTRPTKTIQVRTTPMPTTNPTSAWQLLAIRAHSTRSIRGRTTPATNSRTTPAKTTTATTYLLRPSRTTRATKTILVGTTPTTNPTSA